MTYKIKGINNDTDTCSCCGKTGLKRVVWLEEIDGTADPAPYGTSCAARLLGMTGTKSSLENRISADLHTAIIARQHEIKNTMAVVNGYCIPSDLVNLPLDQALKIRNERYPILEYGTGRMDITAAARYL